MSLSAFALRPASRLSTSHYFTGSSLLRSFSRFWKQNVPPQEITLPIIDTCPAPTCACAPTPEGLSIDRKQPLLDTKPPYHKHLVICTGRADWTSKIEGDTGPHSVARELKSLLGPKGRFHDPQKNILITNSSLVSRDGTSIYTSACLFPDFKYFSRIGTKGNSLEEFVASVREPPVLPTELVGNINQVTVFVCGHGKRDQRCGIMGPLLETEFQRAMRNKGMNVFPAHDGSAPIGAALDHKLNARVALISHIGGHKWAGNVIIYIPPKFKPGGLTSTVFSELAGRGIWYGRVEPKHVEGIVEETILGGKVIKELFRGATEPKAVADAKEAGSG